MVAKRRILIVEDQAGFADLAAQALSDTYEAVCAPTVPDAIETLLGGDIALVLLDCVLPGGTMWQVLLEADRQQVPVVLMTGDPAQMREIDRGPRPYLLKPFSIAALLDIIDSTAGPTATGPGRRGHNGLHARTRWVTNARHSRAGRESVRHDQPLRLMARASWASGRDKD